MRFGGTFLYSKYDCLRHLPSKWVPKTIVIKNNDPFDLIIEKLEHSKIEFPLIAKPDQAERGKGVEKLKDKKQLKDYCNTSQYKAILLQKFIDYPIEIGVLFYWDTTGNPRISSMGYKSFCTLVGDGKKTIGRLITENHRIAHRLQILKNNFSDQWNLILPKGRKMIVEPIGNHNRGTVFLNANHKIDPVILDWVANCMKPLKGFDYGRLDIKISDWDAFKKNKGVKILEINGVNSEPIHIYDPSYSIWKAYNDIFRQMRIIFELSKNKIDNQHHPVSLKTFRKGCYQFFIDKNFTL